MEIECSADSNDVESELEELEGAQSVYETETSDDGAESPGSSSDDSIFGPLAEQAQYTRSGRCVRKKIMEDFV
jgi:hypothetical protein